MTISSATIRDHFALDTQASGLLDEFSRACAVTTNDGMLEVEFPWPVCIDNLGDVEGAELKVPLKAEWKPFKKPTAEVRQGTSAEPPALATGIRISRSQETHLKITLDREVFEMKAFTDKWKMPLERLVAGKTGFQRFQGYRLINLGDDGQISALAISRANGQFGNNFKQLTHALHLCGHFGVRRIYVPKLSQFEVPNSRVQVDDLEFVAYNERQEINVPALLGTFFYKDSFPDFLISGSARQQAMVDKYLRPLFMPLRSIEPRPAHHLAIHIRSSDLFNRPNPHPMYVQPPMAFYTLVLDHFRARHPNMAITLVYQDKANPVIDALIAWLTAHSIPFSVHSASLTEDLRALLSHETIVFGRGTFGKAVVSLSPYVKAVYFPWTDMDFRFPLNAKRATGYVISEREVKYIALGEWRNTPAQRELMLDYPETNLSISEM